MLVVLVIGTVIAVVCMIGIVVLIGKTELLEKEIKAIREKEHNDVMSLADLHDELAKEHNKVVDNVNKMQKDFSRQCTYTEHLNRTMQHELEAHKRFVYNTLFYDENANNKLDVKSPMGIDVVTETSATTEEHSNAD